MTQEPLLADQRRLRIIAQLRHDGAVRVKDLATQFGTSAMTIRRDLAVLDEGGLLRQVHGGAVLAPRSPEGEIAPPDVEAHVALLVPTADYYFADIIRGAREVLAELGLAVMVMVSNYDERRERELCAEFVASGASALIYAPTFGPTGETSRLASWLFDVPIPVVLLERDISHPETGQSLSSVRTAYEQGWEFSLRHLRALGHRKVALVTHGLRQVGVNLEPLWQGAALRAGFDPGAAISIIDPRATLSPPPEVVGAIIDQIEESGVTGLISHCDQATLGLVNELRRRGRRIPDDMSIITNEDQIAELASPLLSSNSPVKPALGRTAARLAHELATALEGTVQHVVIQPRFTDRGSTASPR